MKKNIVAPREPFKPYKSPNTVYSVDAKPVEIVPQYRTFLHYSNAHITGYLNYKKDGWTVSEENTGLSIASGKTQKEAIENARQKIADVGEKGMDFAIARGIEYNTKCGLQLA